MKAINARKGNNYKSQAALHGIQLETVDDTIKDSGLSDSQEALLDERLKKLKNEKVKAK